MTATGGGARPPLAGGAPLIDVHAHFYHAGCGRANWQALNDRRMRAGGRIGVTWHVGSILGSWGATSPMYFQSPRDTVVGNDAMLALQRAAPSLIRSYVAVNPNDRAAVDEVNRCVAAGAVGVKIAAARRASDRLLDSVVACAAAYGLPMLFHVWQHRRQHVAGQDISDGADLAELAARHPTVSFLLAHIGGGGDYAHTFAATAATPNVYLDLSGSGVDRGMLDAALAAVGPGRLVWGADLTMETGLAKLWALEAIGLTEGDMTDVRWRNAVRVFPRGTFPGLVADTVVSST